MLDELYLGRDHDLELLHHEVGWNSCVTCWGWLTRDLSIGFPGVIQQQLLAVSVLRPEIIAVSLPLGVMDPVQTGGDKALKVLEGLLEPFNCLPQQSNIVEVPVEYLSTLEFSLGLSWVFVTMLLRETSVFSGYLGESC